MFKQCALLGWLCNLSFHFTVDASINCALEHCILVHIMASSNFYNLMLSIGCQIEMIYKIIAHMAANDRALIAEGSCGSPRSIKVFLGECNVDELYA